MDRVDGSATAGAQKAKMERNSPQRSLPNSVPEPEAAGMPACSRARC